jgi:hypothetical protein
VCGALAAAGCAARTHEGSASAEPPGEPPVFVGEYEATGAGDVAAIGFYGNEYSLRPSSCEAKDDACRIHGTFRADVAAGVLVLHPDGSTAETTWPLRVLEVGAMASGGAAPRSLQALATTEPGVQPPLVGQPSCLLTSVASSVVVNGATYVRADVDADFRDSVFQPRAQTPGSSSTLFAGMPGETALQQQLAQAVSSCSDTSRFIGSVPKPGVALLNWRSIPLVDVQSCARQADTSNGVYGRTHTYYTADGQEVGTYDERSQSKTVDVPPMALLLKELGQCR